MLKKIVRKLDFLSTLFCKQFPEHRKIKFEFGWRLRICQNDLPFRNGFEPQSTETNFNMSPENRQQHKYG